MDEVNPSANAGADEAWNEAGTYAEKQRLGRIAAQVENEQLKARLARAGVEERKAVFAERDACAKLVESKQDLEEEVRARAAAAAALKDGNERRSIDCLSQECTVRLLNTVLRKLGDEVRARQS